jgi:MATE family, multidrug efflux pump
MTMVLAGLFTAGLELGAPVLFALMGGSGEVLAQATLFARVLFGGIAIAFFAGTLDSVMRGEGNVRIPAVAAIVSLGLQIGLTPLYMFGAHLGLAGAPLATITGQIVGLVPRIWFIFGGRGHIRPRLWPRSVAWHTFAEILRVGVPASVAAILNYAALLVLTGTFAHIDSTHLAAYGLGTRVDFLLFSLGYGVAAATITLVGMATGAKRWELVGAYVRQTMLGVAVVVALPCALVILRPSLWLGIFTADPGIHRVGASYFRIVGPSYPFAMASMVLASAFQGLGRATIPLAVIVVRVAVVVALAIALTRYFGAGARPVFLVIAGGNALSSVLLALMFRRVIRSIAPAAARA